MEIREEDFLQVWRGILSHSKKEGPHTNILQYQQEGCELLEKLRREILLPQNALCDSSSLMSTTTGTTSSGHISDGLDSPTPCFSIASALLRLVAVDAALGALLITLEEEERGISVLLRGCTVLQYVMEKKLKSKFHEVEPFSSFSSAMMSQISSEIGKEEQKALKSILTLKDIVYQISATSSSSKKRLYEVTPTSDDVLAKSFPLPFVSFPYWGSSLLVLLLNGLGLYITKTLREWDLDIKDPLSVAVIFFEYGETVYQEWDHMHNLDEGASETDSHGCTSWLNQIKDGISEETGELVLDSIPSESHPLYWERYLMEDARLHTFFFLAQGLTHQGRVIEAFHCCRMTLYLQLALQNREISRLEWAKNMLQLFNHYCSSGAFGHALHCLQAADAAISMDKDSHQEDREEALGYLYWSYGKYHQSRLQFYGERKGKEDINAEGPSSLLHKLDFSKGWADFPLDGVPPFSLVPPLTNYDEARKEFIDGVKWFNTALNYFRFELLCTSHIKIQQDICKLYTFLCYFESDPLRVIACVQRQISILEPFASKLNFNAYPTLQRQLLYDTGCLREELVERCAEQRAHWPDEKTKEKNRIFTDTGFNKLIDKSIQIFASFCHTWTREREGRERRKKNLASPNIENLSIEEENRETLFRALIRIGRLHTLKAYISPKEEYEGIKQACDEYEKALTFAQLNGFSQCSSVSNEELKITMETVELLKAKQKDLYNAYCH